MYLVLVGVLAAAANVAAQAQAIPGLPSCAVSCLSSGFAQAGCSSTDLACQCGDISSAAGTATAACLLSACDLTDILQAQNAVQSMCSSFSATGGVGAAPSTITSVPSVSTGSATATTTRTTTRSTSTTPGASSVAGAQETPATSLSTTGASTPSFTSPTVPAGSSSGNSGGSSSSSGTMIGGIVGGVVGALFLGGLVVWLIMRRRGSTRAAAAITSEEGQQQPAGMPELATTPAGKPMATAWAYPSTPGELPGASISPVSPHGYGYGPPPPWQPPGHQSAELDNAGIGPTELGATSGLPPELSATVYTQPVELGSGSHGYMGGSNTQDQQGRTPQQ